MNTADTAQLLAEDGITAATMIGPLFSIMGVVIVMLGLGTFLHGLRSPYGSAGKGLAMILLGGSFCVGGPSIVNFMMSTLVGKGTSVAEGLSASDSGGASPSAAPTTPAATPSPAATTAPTPAIPATPAEPINWGPILMVLAIAIALVIVGVTLLLIARVTIPRIAAAKDDALTAAEKRRDLQAQIDSRFATAKANFKDASAKWQRYDTDLEAILHNPLMRDASHPAIAAVLRAKSVAESLETERAPRIGTSSHITMEHLAYVNAVQDFVIALQGAEDASRLAGTTGFDPKERQQIAQAIQLLQMAADSGASENERQLAYERAIDIVKKLKKLDIKPEQIKRFAIESKLEPVLLIGS